MAYDRFLIAPLNSGLVNNTKPWIQADDAFEYLQNAYVFRGRVRKRFGSQMMGTTQLATRLRATLAAGGAGFGITTAGGNAVGNVRTILADATLPLAVGQMFSVGTEVYTVISSTPGVQPMLATMGTGTFNITTGDFVIAAGPALTTIFFYPALPVMGITQYEINAVNNHPTYAFDTRYAYSFVTTNWERSGAVRFLGSNVNYVWASNWQGLAGTKLLFVTNFNATIGAPGANDDPMYYFDGTTWTSFSPLTIFLTGGNFVRTARIILPFKNRLILLNTIESNAAGNLNTAFVNRCRYSFNGSPLAVNAWLEPNQTTGGQLAAGAGFIDATTEEAIISAEFIKDRLIVYFERSTWELAYTGNEILPFVWQKINTELGSQSTFSTVPFDRDVLTIGQSGVHACSGTAVRRIDEKIPDHVFEFETGNNQTIRTCGIRDYYTEMVYWAYVSNQAQLTQTFPNKILVYNYKNGSWAINDDCFTTFGYFEQQTDITWASSAPVTWQQFNGTWNSQVLQSNQRVILGGTPEGFVLKLNVESSRNAPSMYITNMSIAVTGTITLTIINHNLDPDPDQNSYDSDFILIENVVADADTMNTLNGNIFQVLTAPTADTITIFVLLFSGTYSGGGTASRVSNVQITTKEFNPYVDQNRSVYVAKVDFAVGQTEAGEITVDYYTSSAEQSMIAAAQATTSIMGTNVLETKPYPIDLYPFEQEQKLLWHSIYFQSSGEFIQLVMYFGRNQMMNPNISLVEFELEAMCLITQPTSERMQ